MPKIRLNVSTRIIGGYAIALLLTLAILFTSLSGISSINRSLTSVTDQALPMVDEVSALLSSQLEAQIQLIEFQKAENEAAFSEIEARYRELVNSNSQERKTLSALTKSEAAMAKKMKLISDAQDAMFAAGEEVMSLHRASISNYDRVNNEFDTFANIGDEVIGHAADLEEETNESIVKSLLGTLTLRLDNTSELSLEILEYRDLEDVIDGQERLQSNFVAMNRTFNTMNNRDSLKNSSTYASLKQMYQQFQDGSTGAAGIVQAQRNYLQNRADALAGLQRVSEFSSEATNQLNALKNDIRNFSGNIADQTSATISSSQSFISIFSIIALIIVAAIGWIVTQSIRKPLRETMDAIEVVAQGDLTQTFKADRDDELGELSASMQMLVSQLRNIIEDITLNSTQLAATAEQTAAISEKSSENINRQKDQTNMIATAIEEMAATVEEVSRSINNTLHEVESAHKDVSEGTTILNDNIQAIHHLAEEIDSASAIIERLNQDTENVGSVLDVIRGVAEQTNLLALNAAIEAARAGEQGRGFAVVADEVRTLASRAHASTEEIQEMITRLQAGATEAVQAMNKSRGEAQGSVEGISKAGEMLNLIAEGINRIKDMSHQISSAAEEQAATTQEQNRNVASIADVAEETASAAKENHSASDELAKMADAQLTLVGRFKV